LPHAPTDREKAHHDGVSIGEGHCTATSRRPIGSSPTATVLADMVKDHTDRAFTKLGEYLLGRGMGHILSRNAPSDKPGTVQFVVSDLRRCLNRSARKLCQTSDVVRSPTAIRQPKHVDQTQRLGRASWLGAISL
jgi:hypothetical protein